ncbi:MAG: hypothetical protein ACRBBW_10480 [Cellvibrionaceae bacterium]
MPEIRQITLRPAPADLLSTLAQFRQLPILPGTRESVLSSLHRRNATAVSVAASCQQDPVLKFQLWLSVNETLQSSGNELHHLAHGISLLGLPHTEDIVRNAPQMITPNGGYLECLMQSEISEALARTLMTSEASERECWSNSTLFARCHEWALWHHFPTHMIQRQGLLANPELTHPDHGTNDIETRLFGHSLQELGNQLSQTLALPAPLKSAWQTDWDTIGSAAQACIDDELRKWLQDNPSQESLFFGKPVKLWLINHLSQELAQAPQSEQCQQIIAIVARQSLKPTETIMSLAHQAAVSVSIPVIDWPHPASRLLQHWQAQQVIEPLAIHTSKSTAPAEKLPTERKTKATNKPQSNDDSVEKTLTAFRELARVSEDGEIADIPLVTTPPPPSEPKPSKKGAADFDAMPDFLQLPTERDSSTIPKHSSDNQSIAPQNNPNSPQYRQPKPDTPPPAPFRNSTLLDEHLKRLLERGGQFNNLNQLLLFAVDALAEGIGLERVGMMIIHNKHSLRSHYWRGLDDDDPLKNLTIELNAETQQGIIGQLFKLPAGLKITSANATLVKSRSPAELASLLDENTTALMSLFRDKSPIGIVYGASSNFDAKQFQQFKRLCSATSEAISVFAQQKYRGNRAKSAAPKAAQ